MDPINVVVTLTAYPTTTLLDTLTAPIPAAAATEGEEERLARASLPEAAGGVVLAATLHNVALPELAEFFRSIPPGAYGTTQGIVCIEGAQPGIVVNRIGWVPGT